MSAAKDAPLGGFEQRLSTQLKAEVTADPTLDPAGGARPRRRRLPAFVTAAIAGFTVALLSALTAAAPSLAQASPILSERSQVLPSRLVHALRAQWHSAPAPRFDVGHAYAFNTPAGTGYVVVDQRSRWLCIIVPGYSAKGAAGRCELVTVARAGEPALSVRIGAGPRQELVALLPRGAAAPERRPRGSCPQHSPARGHPHSRPGAADGPDQGWQSPLERHVHTVNMRD